MKLHQLEDLLEALQVDINRERSDRVFDALVGAQYSAKAAQKVIDDLKAI